MVLPEDGTLSAETCMSLLITMDVFYCIFAFSWCVKGMVTLSKMYGKEISR